eukprot:TRINITY_DN64165_c0_g1_i1.p2 TRINITY_DN64165_c0_g1~~TRINITY_DN64165_c0_g1_i1.p2  ORF type:complete len:866 (+),score=74.69 TRINITY_DN64165_c0_g1_i1:17-2614(+)
MLWSVLFCLFGASAAVSSMCMSEQCFSLDGGGWNVALGKIHFGGNVPGDLTTDLQRARIVPDPLRDDNFQNSTIWDQSGWTYTKTFVFAGPSQYSQVLLVVNGIKKPANITLNGQFIGTTVDQFQRYFWDVQKALKDGDNVISIQFTAEKSSRQMACSGGWDWAPYGLDTHAIWQSIYFAPVRTAALEHLVVQQFYQGGYPLSRLADGSASFTVKVGGWYYVGKAGSYSWKVEMEGAHAEKMVNLNMGSNYVELNLTNVKPNLWWPQGYGKQPLYTVSASLDGWTTKREIGFRVFALVTGNDTSASYHTKDGVGSKDFTMMFRVNGVPIYARGANVVPMQELEGRYDYPAHKSTTQMVRYSAAAGMNLLRIWGGGIFQFDEFYDECDRLGVIVYHDMMYAQRGHAPEDAPKEWSVWELKYQIRRLSHHPSIVIWDGCNECNGKGEVTTLVTPTVASVDKSRTIWASCPAGGWKGGADTWYSQPTGGKLELAHGKFESHGPYMHGSGWKTVNSKEKLSLFTPKLPPTISKGKQPVGPQHKGQFKSEFGCTVMSSFESMTSTLSPKNWGLHTPPFKQRNYCVDNIIESYFGKQDLDKVGTLPFQKQLYQSLLSQGLFIKSELEQFRAGNWWGTVIWQLNDIWPTGGWASLEFENNRWKPLHHFLQSSTFQSVMGVCGDDGSCYLRNDDGAPFKGKVTLNLVKFSDGSRTEIASRSMSLPAGGGQISWFCAGKQSGSQCEAWSSVVAAHNCPTTADCILIVEALDDKNTLRSRNVVPLTNLKDMALTTPTMVSAVVASANGNTAQLNVTVSGGAGVFVVLTTVVTGYFSDNAMVLPAGTSQIEFYGWEGLDVNMLAETLRVEHLQMYM